MVQRRTAYSALAGGLAALYGFAFWMVARGLVARAPGPMGAATTVDLTVTAALATWWFGARRGRLHRRAPFVVLALGFVAARLILPANAREGLVVLRVAWALAELAVVALVLARIGPLRRRLRALRLSGVALDDALEQALAPAIGALPSRLVATELTVLGYALGGWRRRTPPEDARRFSMHRRSHYAVIVAVLIFLIAVESFALHLAIAPLSRVAAWLLTASSAWGALWLVGDAQALRLERLRLTAAGLVVQIGIRWRTFVPYDALAEVALAAGAPRGPTTLRATVAGAADVRLVVARPLEARGLFGRRRRFDILLLTVDRPEALIAALASARSSSA
jgi:hypothetical protein